MSGPSVTFTVHGDPVTQGNKTCFCKGGRAVVVEGRRGPARKAFKAWREAVRVEASTHAPIVGPVAVALDFCLRRPKSHLTTTGRLRKGAPLLPAMQRMDLDKLVRAVLDSMTDAGIIEDDGRVVQLTATKVYGDPGVTVTVRPADCQAERAEV